MLLIKASEPFNWGPVVFGVVIVVAIVIVWRGLRVPPEQDESEFRRKPREVTRDTRGYVVVSNGFFVIDSTRYILNVAAAKLDIAWPQAWTRYGIPTNFGDSDKLLVYVATTNTGEPIDPHKKQYVFIVPVRAFKKWLGSTTNQEPFSMFMPTEFLREDIA